MSTQARYRRARAAITVSMGSSGDCYDNGLAESFFVTLECELIRRSRWRTRAAALLAVFHFLETFYNPRGGHSALGYLSVHTPAILSVMRRWAAIHHRSSG